MATKGNMKSDAMTRTLISTAVDKGIRDIEKDPKRSIRQLVDLGTLFAKGRFQRYFFDIFGQVLRNDHSAYYTLVYNLAHKVDHALLKGFGINLAFNSWTVGARTVRSTEASCGYNVPWCIVFRPDGGRAMSVERMQDYIRQGKDCGIYSYMLFCEGNFDLQRLGELLRGNRDCAFLLFAQPAQIDAALPGLLLETRNTLLCLRMDAPGFAEKAALLEQDACLYGAWYRYGAQDLPAIRQGEWTKRAVDAGAPFCLFVAQDNCAREVQAQVQAYALQERRTQQSPVFLMDFYTDLAYIDGIISSDACYLGLSADGGMLTAPGAAPHSAPNLTGTLRQLLQSISPAEKKAPVAL